MRSPANIKRIAELNDQLRSRIGIPVFGDCVPGTIMMTRGICSLPPETQLEIWGAVNHFDSFTESNDPYGEHDFGKIEVCGTGTIFWKIDTYSCKACTHASDDPTDPDKSYRVLTILLASEY